jgi:uncharacterized membrane protein
MSALRALGLGKPIDPPRPTERRKLPEDGLARFLGWFSFGLGVAQLFTPRAVNWLIGVRDDARSRACQRAVGVRELGAAAGIFSQRRPAPWIWGRVAGDINDLALLALGLGKSESRPRTMTAIGSVVAIGITDTVDAVRNTRAIEQDESADPRRVRETITVRATREEVYRFWHDFQNFPRFMAHLESVQVMNGRSHWKATAPAGRTVEWDAEIVEDRPNELISWRTLPNAAVSNTGSVRFAPAPGDRGTEVTVELRYEPPGGAFVAAAAVITGEHPRQQVRDDLRRFKQVVETGSVVRSEGSPEGMLSRRMINQRPAQPLPEPAHAQSR